MSKRGRFSSEQRNTLDKSEGQTHASMSRLGAAAHFETLLIRVDCQVDAFHHRASTSCRGAGSVKDLGVPDLTGRKENLAAQQEKDQRKKREALPGRAEKSAGLGRF